MARKNRKKVTAAAAARAGMRAANRRSYVDALRDGRRERAVTLPDRRKVSAAKACRGKVAW